MQEIFTDLVKGHQRAFEKTFHGKDLEVLERIARALLSSLKAGKKIMLCGNGGSAADAQHIAAEFVGRFEKERRSLPALALTTDTSAITAIGNDYSYDAIFSRQVEGLGNEGDVLIAISTSGNSRNILEAVQAARARKIFTIALTGKDGGKIKDLADCSLIIKSDKTSHIQEMHIFALHAVAEAVEKTFFD
jgi:D-sedoheptulose 7-phosphate isomerase